MIKSNLSKPLLTILLVISSFSLSFATNYTAITSGDFGTASTWQNGSIPPLTIAANDTIYIPQNITVTSTADLTITGAAATSCLFIEGALSMPSNTLRIEDMILYTYSTATITTDSFGSNYRYGLWVDGTITTNKMDGSGLYTYYNTTFNVKKLLYVKDSMNAVTAKVSLGDYGTIIIHGSSKGTRPTLDIRELTLVDTYYVIYKGSSVRVGPEATYGSKINYITIDMDSSHHKVTLSNSIAIAGKLDIKNGTLKVNHHTLAFSQSSDYSIDTTGYLSCNRNTSIIIHCINQPSGVLRFASGGDTIKYLNVKGNITVKFGTDISLVDAYLEKKGMLDVLDNILTFFDGMNTGGFDKDNYIITEGGGYVRVSSFSTHTPAYIPVGTKTEYLPIYVKAIGYYHNVMGRAFTGVREHVTTGNKWSDTKPMLNATWELVGIPPNQPVDVGVEWYPSAEINDFSKSNGAYVSQYDSAKGWDYAERQNLMAFTDGSFTVARKDVKNARYFAVFDKSTIDVQDVKAQDNIIISPNPAQNTLNISTKEPATAYIFNTMGAQMQHSKLLKGDNTIEISTLPQGTYFLKITGSGTNTTFNFIKQ